MYDIETLSHSWKKKERKEKSSLVRWGNPSYGYQTFTCFVCVKELLVDVLYLLMFFPISLNPKNSLYIANTSNLSVKNANNFPISCTLIYDIFQHVVFSVFMLPKILISFVYGFYVLLNMGFQTERCYPYDSVFFFNIVMILFFTIKYLILL